MPGPKLRAVLDTSVLVAGILQPAGPSGQVLQAQYVVTLDAADLLRLKVFLVSGHRPV